MTRRAVRVDDLAGSSVPSPRRARLRRPAGPMKAPPSDAGACLGAGPMILGGFAAGAETTAIARAVGRSDLLPVALDGVPARPIRDHTEETAS